MSMQPERPRGERPATVRAASPKASIAIRLRDEGPLGDCDAVA